MLYLLLEFWPKGMRKDAKVEAHEVLDLLNSHGYAIFDTRTVQIGGDRREPQQLSAFDGACLDRSGLHAIHEARVIHGDLNSGNFWVKKVGSRSPLRGG